MKNITLAL